MFETLDAATDAIRAGQPVEVSELLHLLQKPGIEERIAANLAIGRSFQAIGQHDRAQPYLDRARLLGGPRRRDTHLHWHALRRQGRLHEAQTFLRECVVEAAQIRDFEWMGEAFAGFQSLSRLPGLPRVDTIVSNAILSALRQDRPMPAMPGLRRRLRLGYVVVGETDPTCRLYDIHMALSRLHNRDLFDVSIFTLGCIDDVREQNPRFLTLAEDAEKDNVKVLYNKISGKTFQRAQGLIESITESKIDILIYCGQGSEYFLAAASRPAPLQIGIDYGDPQSYGSRALDFVFAWMKHFIMEAVVDVVPLPAVAYQNIRRDCAIPLTRSSLNISSTAKVMVSIGLADKFQPTLFWDAVALILERHRDTELVVVGIGADAAPGITRLPAGLRSRIHAVGYQDEPNRYLSVANLYLDTIPLGGGYSVYDAIMRGIPCVIGQHAYERVFNLSESFGPMSELLGDAAHATPAEDAEAYAAHALRLLMEPDYARLVCADQRTAMSRYTDRKRMIEEMEEAILTRLGWAGDSAEGPESDAATQDKGGAHATRAMLL